MNCNICNHTSDLFLTSTIFKEKTKISYYKCSNCGFIQTEEPYWLEKAYSDVIAKTDIGLIFRNIVFSNIIESVLDQYFNDLKKALDYGGGLGMFTRIMRDKGYNFLWYDDYCENIFVQTFEGKLDTKYDMITAFEVFEHLPKTNETLEMLLKITDTLIFSTELSDNVTDFENWWYRAEASGQHISFHTSKSLKYLADKHKLNYLTLNNKSIHIFTKKNINATEFNLLFNYSNSLMDRIKRRLIKRTKPTKSSLLQKDFEKIINTVLNPE